MIETDRLILRPLVEADRPAFAALNGDPRVNEWLGGPIDPSASDALFDRIERHFAAHGFAPWAVESKTDGTLVGMVGLGVVEATDLPVGPSVEMAWRFSPKVWGQGLATEAAAAALDWARRSLPGQEIIAFTSATNLRSQAVMRRIGLVADPSRDFDHPRLAPEHPLRRHVVFVAPRL